MKPTDTNDPDYFHKVVDCQWACPAHTPVPAYIRLIAQGKYSDAYLLNRASNVFPGILGRVCDRPCEPACRRTRVEEEPVAICRLKRVAADHRDDITDRLPKKPPATNGKKIALIGAGPASFTVANDLAPMGYECTIFEKLDKPGGLMRSNIPAFRLPETVLMEELGYILDMGVDLKLGTPVKSRASFSRLRHGSSKTQRRRMSISSSIILLKHSSPRAANWSACCSSSWNMMSMKLAALPHSA